MLKKLKFPLIYILELALWFPLFAGFVTVVAFIGAEPIASLDLDGRSLPPTWEAAVANHGKFLEGYLIANHPVAFGLGVLLLVGSAAALYQVHKAMLFQRQSDGASRAMAHNIAHVCVGAAVLALGYIAVMNLFVGVSPV
ncbi:MULTISPECIES: hypothetical protein [Lysobacter]|uniref:DUF4149 domain-containing protein n=1 Tax=Lysobacter gummosus TaxID=262324 RepID=A0ABY3XAG9_9GAMM|nr:MULTISPECIES: hypothetical protein [Lysobacter]UJB19141.1 hypothetical protein L1A79_22980 [Lysobacter capsici]UJQ27134.1 hypothetical protein L2D09_16905 [Lysobacter gummosus]UNP29612.1 hypothetical protein MOV92_24695 [Lysobacter gummosus]